MWFKGDEEKLKEFGDFLIKEDEMFNETDISDLLSDKTYYEKKLDKVRSRECRDMAEVIITSREISKLKHNIAIGKRYSKFYKNKDLGIATYLNSDRYKKKMLDKSEYRKELKKLAKRERREISEMRQLGYIKSKDPDKELNKLLKANKMMEHALSDAYTQKHFID